MLAQVKMEPAVIDDTLSLSFNFDAEGQPLNVEIQCSGRRVITHPLTTVYPPLQIARSQDSCSLKAINFETLFELPRDTEQSAGRMKLSVSKSHNPGLIHLGEHFSRE